MRRCPRCGWTLPESDFYRMGNRLQGWCRECSRSYNREWRRDNPGKRYLPCPAGWQEDRMLACPCKRIVCCICSLLSFVFAILIVCYDGSSTRRKGCAMGTYFHVIDRRDSESIERFRRELGRLRETEHLHSDRSRETRAVSSTAPGCATGRGTACMRRKSPKGKRTCIPSCSRRRRSPSMSPGRGLTMRRES